MTPNDILIIITQNTPIYEDLTDISKFNLKKMYSKINLETSNNICFCWEKIFSARPGCKEKGTE